MVRWFDPRLIAKLLLEVIISKVFGQYADRRLIHAALDKPTSKDFKDRLDLAAAQMMARSSELPMNFPKVRVVSCVG